MIFTGVRDFLLEYMNFTRCELSDGQTNLYPKYCIAKFSILNIYIYNSSDWYLQFEYLFIHD